MKGHLVAAVAACLLAVPAAAQMQQGPVPVGYAVKDYAADEALARQRVSEIVNQPVQSYPLSDAVTVSKSSPGWFHAGARTPDWDNVDVRASQDVSTYAGAEYATSDVTPGEMFRSSDIAFNADTKIFYADRSRPKKRLSDSELTEINGLYRMIGRDERGLHAESRARMLAPVKKGGALLVVVAGLFLAVWLVSPALSRKT